MYIHTYTQGRGSGCFGVTSWDYRGALGPGSSAPVSDGGARGAGSSTQERPRAAQERPRTPTAAQEQPRGTQVWPKSGAKSTQGRLKSDP